MFVSVFFSFFVIFGKNYPAWLGLCDSDASGMDFRAMLRKRKYAKWKNEEQKEEVDLKTVEPPKPALKKVERVSFDFNKPPIPQQRWLRSERQRVCKLESHTKTLLLCIYLHDVVLLYVFWSQCAVCGRRLIIVYSLWFIHYALLIYMWIYVVNDSQC